MNSIRASEYLGMLANFLIRSIFEHLELSGPLEGEASATIIMR